LLNGSDGWSGTLADPEVKAQIVRVADVLLLGPIMIIASAMVKDPYVRATLAIGGVGTMAYNAANYATIERRRAKRAVKR
jgi:hypothetical protein